MSDMKDVNQQEYWQWPDPECIDNGYAVMLNYNISCVMSDIPSLFPGEEDPKRLELMEFVRNFYQNDRLSFSSVESLAKSLILLRSVDLTIQNIQEMIKRDEPLNSARQVLVDILPVIMEDQYLIDSLWEYLDCTK